MAIERFSKAFLQCQNSFSTDIRVRYFNQFGDDTYDDAPTLTKSGNDVWVKGTIQSLDKTEGSADANLLEQGKIINEDTKIYFNGSIALTNYSNMFKLQIGSPTGDWYSLIPLGVINRQVNGLAIFETAYVRRLTNGSMIGEI